LRSRALRAAPEKLQGMVEIREAILLLDPPLRLLDRARRFQHDDLPALRAYKVIVMLARVRQLVIAARALEIDLVHNVQPFEQNHHAENRRVIREHSPLRKSLLLDLHQGERAGCLEESQHDSTPAFGDTHPLVAK